MAKKTSESPAKRGVAISKICVDYWKTKMHGATMGIKKDLEYIAKTPQFTKEYEIKGGVYFNDDKNGEKNTNQVIAVNLADLGQKPLERRLLVRNFTVIDGDKGGRYLGGIEMSMLDSLQVSLAAGEKPISVMVVQLPNFEYLIRIYRIRKIHGDSFCFMIPPDEKDERFMFFELAGKAGAGDDFNIKEGDEVIGDIDENVLDIGGKFNITLKGEEYQYHKTLHQVLILFCCAMKYLKDLENDLEKLLGQVQKKKSLLGINFKPYAQELDLMKNPRKFKG